MTIVPFEITDKASVAALFREIFVEMGWVERESDYMDKPHLLFHLPDGGILLLIKNNSKVIGTAGVIFLSKTDGLMKRFYINQKYRGSGVAQRLLKEVIKTAKSKGIKKLILDVSSNNARAIRFYGKSSFTRTMVNPQEGWPESYQPDTHYYF